MYEIIYADPPWPYNKRASNHAKFGRGVHGHYPVMTYKELKALDVSALAAENCALCMWATLPYLPEQLAVMQAWGFDYRTTLLVWVKTNARQNTKQLSFVPEDPDLFFGVGYYTKSNAELCLLGMRGQVKVVDDHVSNILIAPISKHSRKPPEARHRIERLFGNRRRIELFARETAPGWDVYGNEVDSDVILDTQKLVM